jgi:hypothetical protein
VQVTILSAVNRHSSGEGPSHVQLPATPGRGGRCPSDEHPLHTRAAPTRPRHPRCPRHRRKALLVQDRSPAGSGLRPGSASRLPARSPCSAVLLSGLTISRRTRTPEPPAMLGTQTNGRCRSNDRSPCPRRSPRLSRRRGHPVVPVPCAGTGPGRCISHKPLLHKGLESCPGSVEGADPATLFRILRLSSVPTGGNGGVPGWRGRRRGGHRPWGSR